MDSRAKSIVLFSDGTGNSSAKLFKTNVWRMYEAVDLGPSPTGQRDQISFYDDGVGTSNFKFLAALGGAFGWGLKRNVLDLYRYACRNYRPGDHIYGFGFSRGAFTMRLVIALIASQGLVQSEDETELDRKSREAYRAFRSAFHLRKFKRLTHTARRARDSAAKLAKRADKAGYRREDNLDPEIRFVGAWDTVAAYGGPIAEITRAIDNWFYPLSMPDYELDEKILCARHALAIDDERDAFQPLLWDELAEDRRAYEAAAARKIALENARTAKASGDEAERKRWAKEAKRCGARENHFRTRMQQVWFTGMHADVGGGYPDESLSYVSLLWMMEEAEKAGLRTLVSIKDRFFALANSYGPMHDSRAGMGAYYRYQPRKIAAWVASTDAKENARYLMLRDPDVRDSKGEARGLLRCVCVHESVIARINSGTVRYAPIALPGSFHVVPPQQEGEKIEQADESVGPRCKYARPPSEPLITPQTRALVEREAPDRFACQENLWDLVWWRRIGYFATVFVTILFVALPFWNPLPSFVDELCSDSRCVLPSLIRPASALVPVFLEPWTTAIARYPFTAILLVLAIFILLRWTSSIEARLWDRSYRLWRRLLDGKAIHADQCRETGLRAFREGSTYQQLFRDLKWHALPAVFGMLMLAVILYVPLVALTQASIQLEEADHFFCGTEASHDLPTLGQASFDFDTSRRCMSVSAAVKEGEVYDVVFQLPVQENGEPVPWWDDDIVSKPGMLTRVRAATFPQLVGMPLRRVIEASYLQPLAQITPVQDSTKEPWHWLPEGIRSWLGKLNHVHITRLQLDQDEDWPELYRVRFKAERSGILHLFANDAQLPFGFGHRFYANNCGVAHVTITHIVPRNRNDEPQKLIQQPGGPIAAPDCAKPKLAMLAGETRSSPIYAQVAWTEVRKSF